jgi:hypothetical protein
MKDYKPGDRIILDGLPEHAPLYGMHGEIVRRAIYPTEAKERANWWIVTTPNQNHSTYTKIRDGWLMNEAQFSHLDIEPSGDNEFDEARKRWLEKL